MQIDLPICYNKLPKKTGECNSRHFVNKVKLKKGKEIKCQHKNKKNKKSFIFF